MKISELKKMTVDALLEARDAIENALSEKTASLRKQLASLGNHGARGDKAKQTRKAHPAKGKRVAAKYRGPNGETWAGRGARPRWLTALTAEGRTADEFLVTSPTSTPKKQKRAYVRRDASKKKAKAA